MNMIAAASLIYAPSGIIDPESVPSRPGSLIICLRSFIIAFVSHGSSDHFLIQDQAVLRDRIIFLPDQTYSHTRASHSHFYSDTRTVSQRSLIRSEATTPRLLKASPTPRFHYLRSTHPISAVQSPAPFPLLHPHCFSPYPDCYLPPHLSSSPAA